MRERKGTQNRLWAVALVLALALGAPALAAGGTIYGYAEGLALTTDGSLWGYVDAAGRIVVPCRYQSAQSFQLGLAKVEKDRLLGVIRPDGTYLIRPEYDTLTSVGYGVYLAQKGDFWGVLSLLPFPSGTGQTQVFYPFAYSDIRQEQSSGLSVLAFFKDGARTAVPVSSLPDLLVQRRVPSARFPLIQGRLPSFTDVGPRDWYTLWVDIAYNVGLMDGKGDGTFDPHGTLTVAEALKLAAQMESRYTGDDFHLRNTVSRPWYGASVAYCVAGGIIRDGEFDGYEKPVTRGEMAKIFAATSLGRSLPQRNDLSQVKARLPDVKAGDYAADAICDLYAKGIFTGTDGALRFRPNDPLTRAEAAAIVARMARSEQQVTLWPTKTRSVPIPELPTD